MTQAELQREKCVAVLTFGIEHCCIGLAGAAIGTAVALTGETAGAAMTGRGEGSAVGRAVRGRGNGAAVGRAVGRRGKGAAVGRAVGSRGNGAAVGRAVRGRGNGPAGAGSDGEMLILAFLENRPVSQPVSQYKTPLLMPQTGVLMGLGNSPILVQVSVETS
jgi:hypothetical protein